MKKGQIKIALSILALFGPFVSQTASSFFYKAPSDSSIDIGLEIISSTPIESSIVRYYFIDQSWWNSDSAESGAYMFNSTNNSYKTAWPGESMTRFNYDSEAEQNTWYIDIDLDLYDKLIIARKSGTTFWGAQTEDIILSKDFNTITLSKNSAWNSDGKKASFTTSYINY